MLIESFVKSIPKWLFTSNGIIISGRIRVIRNLKDYPFSTFLNEEKGIDLRNNISIQLKNYFELNNVKYEIYNFEELNQKQIEILLEMRLIRPGFINNSSTKGICITEDGKISILINDIDHIKIQVFSEGLSLIDSYMIANSVDDYLINNLNISFSKDFGYITSSPTNIGTGLKVSTMMHIPSLVSSGEISDIAKFLSRKDTILKDLFGREDYLGDIYQIGNTVTLGKTEEEIITEIEKISKQISGREEKHRYDDYFYNIDEIQDRINKSKEIIVYSKYLSLEEASEILSLLRMSKLAGFIPEIELNLINEAMVIIRSGLIKAQYENIETLKDEDKVRSEILRKLLNA